MHHEVAGLPRGVPLDAVGEEIVPLGRVVDLVEDLAVQRCGVRLSTPARIVIAMADTQPKMRSVGISGARRRRVVAGISIGARDIEDGRSGPASSTSVVMGTVVT
jgi:hypothetical protein